MSKKSEATGGCRGKNRSRGIKRDACKVPKTGRDGRTWVRSHSPDWCINGCLVVTVKVEVFASLLKVKVVCLKRMKRFGKPDWKEMILRVQRTGWDCELGSHQPTLEWWWSWLHKWSESDEMKELRCLDMLVHTKELECKPGEFHHPNFSCSLMDFWGMKKGYAKSSPRYRSACQTAARICHACAPSDKRGNLRWKSSVPWKPHKSSNGILGRYLN